MKTKNHLTKHYFRISSFIAVFAIVAIWAFVYSGNMSLTGGVTSLDGTFETLNISSQITHGSSIEINKELTSLKINGEFRGEGDAKVYAIVDGKKLLVYEYNKKDKKKNSATGFVTYGGEITQEIYKDDEEYGEEYEENISFENILVQNISVQNISLDNITFENKSFIENNLTNLTNLTNELNELNEINDASVLIINISQENNLLLDTEVEVIEQIETLDEIGEDNVDNDEEYVENEYSVEDVKIIVNGCMETCMLQPVFVSSLLFEIKNSELFLESIIYTSSEKGLFLQNEFENIEMHLGSFKLINLQDYFSTSAYFDASTSEGYTYLIEGSTLKITSVKEGNWPIKIYAVNADGLITSNDFFIIIKNSISFGNIPSFQDEFNVEEIVTYEIDESLFEPENYEIKSNLENVLFEIDDELNEKIQEDINENSNDDVRVIIKYKDELTNSHTSINSYVDDLKNSNLDSSVNLNEDDFVNLKKDHFIQSETIKTIKQEVTIIDEALLASKKINGNVAVERKLSKDKEYRVIQLNKLESDIQKLESQIIDEQRARKISDFNVTLEKTIQSSAIEVASIKLSQIELLFENEEIEAIYLDQPIVPLFTESSSIIKLNQAQNYAVANLGFNLTGDGVNVCLVDSGVNFDVVPYSVGFDFVNDDLIPDDDNGHGTMVGYVLYSVAPSANLIVVKALNSSAQAYESDIILALNYCTEQGANVISLSLGSGAYTGWCDNNILAQEVNELSSQGVVVVAASGNDGSSEMIRSPACARGAIAVGSSNKEDELSSFSNYNAVVNLVAPGENVETINLYGAPQVVSGTSMSVPFVAGSVALLYQGVNGFGDYDFVEKKNRLISTGDTIIESDRITDDERNFSRLNVYNALIGNLSYSFVFTNLSVDYNNATDLVVEGQLNRCYVGVYSNCTSGQAAYCQDDHWPTGDGDGSCETGEICYCVSTTTACQHSNSQTSSGSSVCNNYVSPNPSVIWSCSNSVWSSSSCGYKAPACIGTCQNTSEANTCSGSACSVAGGNGNVTTNIPQGYTCQNGVGTTSIYCGTGSPSCAGEGAPFSCSLVSDNLYCDDKGTCGYDSGTDSTSYGDRSQVCAYVGGTYQFVNANSSHYASNDSQRCSTSTPASGYGDLIVSLYACDGAGGIEGSSFENKVIQDCGTGCCYAGTSCIASGNYNVYNWYNFGAGDGVSGAATDYCIASVVKDCYNDGDCGSGYSCNATNECEFLCTSNADCPSNQFCSGEQSCEADFPAGDKCDYFYTYVDNFTEANGVCSSGYCRDTYGAGSDMDGRCDSGEECFCASSSTACVSGPSDEYTTGSNASDTCMSNGAGTTPGQVAQCSNGAWIGVTCGYSAYNQCSGACQEGRDVMFCTNLTNTCYDGGQNSFDYLEGTGVVCSAGSEVAPNASIYCDTTIDCVDNACSAARYYRGCAAGTGSCTETNKVSYTAWNSGAGTSISATSYAVGTTCTTNSDQCSTTDHCVGETFYDGYLCSGTGSCTTHTAPLDKDSNSAYCTSSASGCTPRTWYTNTFYSGSNYYCCGDDGASDSFSVYSASLSSATSASCSRCNAGTPVATATFYGNGYYSGNLATSTSLICYYGDIVCAYNSGVNGTSVLIFGNGYANASNTTATLIKCYYGDLTCGDNSYANGTNADHCGNGFFSSSNTLCTAASNTTATSGYCYYGDIACGNNYHGNGLVSPLIYGNGYTSGNNLTDQTLVCYSGDIGCGDNYYANSTSVTLCGNGFFSSSNTLCTAASNTSATSGYCYYGDISCGNGYSSNGTVSSLLYGNGNWIGTTCFYGDIVCGNGNSGNGTSGATQCSSGITTCCNAGTYYEGVSCTNGAVANPTYDRDTSQARCEYSSNGCTAYAWNIGGEVNATVCCGDDASENIRTRVAHAGMDNGYVTNATDRACCLASTDCVDDSVCVDTGNVARDADGDGDNDYCNAGTWYDCSTDAQCGTGFYCSSNNCVASAVTVTYQNPTPANNSRGINNAQTINVSVTSVGSNVANCTLEWNGVNESMTMVGSGTSVTCNKVKSSLIDGTTYNFKVYANNTVGTIANESQRTFIENTLPPTPTHLTPANAARAYANSQVITWSAGGVDAQGDTITYYWRIDTDATPATPFTCSSSTTGTTSTACSTVDGTTYYWNIITSDGYENRTATTAFSFRENAKPSISAVTITPATAYTSNDLNCSVSGWSDSDSDTAQYYFQWYNGTTLKSTTGPTSIAYNVLSSSQTLKGQTWNCTVTPYDGYENGTAINATKTIINSAPSQVTLVYPGNANTSFTNRTPRFIWNAASDADGDIINYNIVVASDSAFTSIVVNQTTTNAYYDQASELAFGNYYWKVQSNDSFNAGTMSSTFNFTLVTYVSVSMVVANVTFTSYNPGQYDDTTDDNPTAYVVKSSSNTYIDGRNFNVTAPLWSSVGLATSYWQMKVRTKSDGSFNVTGSKTDFFNVTNTTYVVRKLNYSSTRNNATLDVAITVPTYESPGAKYAQYGIDWEVAS